jgi:hypothetical protein
MQASHSVADRRIAIDSDSAEPLPAYIQSGFVSAYSFGPYAILVRRA